MPQLLENFAIPVYMLGMDDERERKREYKRAWVSRQAPEYFARKKAYGLQRMKQWRKRDPIGFKLDVMFRAAKKRAAVKGLAFSLQAADLKYTSICPVLGIPLDWNSTIAKGDSPSLDRINPALGYIPSNTWVISLKANTIKSNATPSELQKVARAVYWLLGEDD
jgi:hypothetical protein